MREIHSLSDFSICPRPRAAPAARPRRAPKVNFLLRRQKLDSLTFLKNPPNPPRTLSVHDVIHIPLVTLSPWDFYFDISEWHILPARAWTPALMLHLTNPCAKRKVLSLTKPKGKIYRTKFLGHYITNVFLTLLGGKRFLKLFWVLIFQIFRDNSNIIVLEVSRNFKTSEKPPIGW